MASAVRTLTDITERKKNEIDLARARDAAEAGVRARTEFLAVISHEIRTPMNGIIGAAGLLRDMRLDTEQREYVRIIRESSDHLSSLMQNILDFSRLDMGRLDLEEIAFQSGRPHPQHDRYAGRPGAGQGVKLEARTGGDVRTGSAAIHHDCGRSW